MIKPVFILLFAIFGQPIFGQVNLVPNGSFEEYYECPSAANNNNGQFERAKNWWSPTMSTPDYFNSCSAGEVSVPDNFRGSQAASQGQAYGGFVPVEFIRSSKVLIGGEYMTTRLKAPLNSCNVYKLSFDVSLGESSNFAFTNLGAYLSIDSIYIFNEYKLPFNSTVSNNVPLTNTVNWQRLEFEIFASGGEEYLTLGHFTTDFSDTIFLFDSGVFPDRGYAFYYLDNVVLERIGVDEKCLPEIPNVVTPNGDKINDVIDFSAIILNGGTVQIINRWGENIKEISFPELEWNPSDDNLTDGIYFYRALIVINDQTIQKTGFIQLVR